MNRTILLLSLVLWGCPSPNPQPEPLPNPGCADWKIPAKFGGGCLECPEGHERVKSHGVYGICTTVEDVPCYEWEYEDSNGQTKPRAIYCNPTEQAEAETTKTRELPSCVVLYHRGDDPNWVGDFLATAVKIPLEDDELFGIMPTQRYVYEICERVAVNMNHPSLMSIPGKHPITDNPDCEFPDNGGAILLGDGTMGGMGLAVEVSEHCLDDPISGRCKKWNCAEYLDQIPYPETCGMLPARIKAKAGAECSTLWGK